MKKINFTILIVFISGLLLFNSCAKDTEKGPLSQTTQAPVNSDDERYKHAIEDAMIAEPGEICNKLIAINDSNTYLTWSGTVNDKKVLVVTWTKYPGSYPEGATITTSWGEVWVTVVPEIEDWFKNNYSSGSNYVFRAEELLGLPKNKGYTHFAELWVNPADLFRPSPDNEVTDNVAQLDFPPNADSTYKVWFNNNIIYSYYPMRFPWTRLGYTYDWGNSTSEIGLSEFVIKNNSQVTVFKVYDNATFFNNIFSSK